jgi:hypothetical protein
MNLKQMLCKISVYGKAGQVVTRNEVRSVCLGLPLSNAHCTAGVEPDEVLFAELRNVRAIKLVDRDDHYGEMIVDADRARQLLDLFEIWEITDEDKDDSDCTCVLHKTGTPHRLGCPLSDIEAEVANTLQHLADR